MLLQRRLLLSTFSVCCFCYGSTALLLSTARGSTINIKYKCGDGSLDDFYGYRGRDGFEVQAMKRKTTPHPYASLRCVALSMKRQTRDDYEGETKTLATATTTRQHFLSTVCSRVATTSAVIAGVHSGNPTVATAMEPRTIGNAEDASGIVGNAPRARVLSLALRSLPVSGCWAVPVTLSSDDDEFFDYLAVVDTGSPFLTAPPGAAGALRQTKQRSATSKRGGNLGPKKTTMLFRSKESFRLGDSHHDDDTSYEQYGNTVGGVQWRIAPHLTLVGNGKVDDIVARGIKDYACDENGKICCSRSDSGVDTPKGVRLLEESEIEPIVIQDESVFIVGVPSEDVITETGGIFFGLMSVDGARPTTLQQLGYDAFVMRFGENEESLSSGSRKKDKGNTDPATLVLWNGKQNDNGKTNPATPLVDPFDPCSMKLFDLTPFGPNLHHYAVLCDRFECWWAGNDSISFDCVQENGSNICTPPLKGENGVSLSRPLIAVFDTGLSGCIFSDTLWEEVQRERRRKYKNEAGGQRRGRGTPENPEESYPVGCTVRLPTISNASEKSYSTPTVLPPKSSSSHSTSIVELSSISEHWRFQSFRLPWWYADSVEEKNGNASQAQERDNNFPHVIVLGSTFWRNPNIQELAVDTISQRAKIETT